MEWIFLEKLLRAWEWKITIFSHTKENLAQTPKHKHDWCLSWRGIWTPWASQWLLQHQHTTACRTSSGPGRQRWERDGRVTDVQTKGQLWPGLCRRSAAGTAARRRKMRRQGNACCYCVLSPAWDFSMHTKSLLKPLTANLHQGRRKSYSCAVLFLGTVLTERPRGISVPPHDRPFSSPVVLT